MVNLLKTVLTGGGSGKRVRSVEAIYPVKIELEAIYSVKIVTVLYLRKFP